ncbi:cytochrome oxidase small assembly protein [Chitinivorax sp. B]|nr:cytochrome oxidase small assembly protein [Chitinivorax sp. B]
MSKNLKTALILASCALVFFAGFIVKQWLIGR